MLKTKTSPKTSTKPIAKSATKSSPAKPAKAIAKPTPKSVAKTPATSPSVKRDAIDPDAAKSAYDRGKKRYAAIPSELLTSSGVPVDGAVTGTRSLVRHAKTAQSTLALLPAVLFDPTAVARLDDDALALFYVHGKANGDRANQTRAKLPPDLVTRATAQRARMLRLATYHFDDDATLGPEIARIRIGTGYADLAHDLSDLADIYDAELTEVKEDPKYVANDESTARATSMEILDTLGLGTKSGWTGIEARVLSSLAKGYADVASTLAWIGRNEPTPVRVPTLTIAADPDRSAKIRHGMSNKPAPAPTGSGPTAAAAKS